MRKWKNKKNEATKLRMQALGVTTTDLGRRLGVCAGTISRILSKTMDKDTEEWINKGITHIDDDVIIIREVKKGRPKISKPKKRDMSREERDRANKQRMERRVKEAKMRMMVDSFGFEIIKKRVLQKVHVGDILMITSYQETYAGVIQVTKPHKVLHISPNYILFQDLESGIRRCYDYLDIERGFFADEPMRESNYTTPFICIREEI